MRILIRSLIFWAICLPIFYLVGLPILMDKLDARIRGQNYDACFTHLKNEGLFGSGSAVLKKDQAEHYCHCVSDSLTLDRRDLFDLLKKRPPAHLTAAMKPVVEACNTELTQAMNAVITAAPAPRVTRAPDGTEVMHFDTPVQYK
jgi:hypothetical protein